jgi:hypothetical protein
MHTAEVVIREMQGDGGFQVLQLARESILVRREHESIVLPCPRPRYTDPKFLKSMIVPFPSSIRATITVSSVLESDTDQLIVRASPVLQQLWPPLQPPSVYAFLRGKCGVSSIAQTS